MAVLPEDANPCSTQLCCAALRSRLGGVVPTQRKHIHDAIFTVCCIINRFPRGWPVIPTPLILSSFHWLVAAGFRFWRKSYSMSRILSTPLVDQRRAYPWFKNKIYHLYLFTNLYFHSWKQKLSRSKPILKSAITALEFRLSKYLQQQSINRLTHLSVCLKKKQ